MSQNTRTVYNAAGIAGAVEWITRMALKGLEGGKAVVWSIKPETRTLEQNAKLHATITDISKQVVHKDGQKYPVKAWKLIFMHEYHSGRVDYAPAISEGIVPLSYHTSDLYVGQMAELIMLVTAYGDEKGVRWKAPERYEG